MRCIIAGGREIWSYSTVYQAIEASGFKDEITVVVSGTSPGVDLLGEQWAKLTGRRIERYPAQWEKYGKAAGMIRNRLMAENADALIAVPGRGPGTPGMIKTARQLGLRVYVHGVA